MIVSYCLEVRLPATDTTSFFICQRINHSIIHPLLFDRQVYPVSDSFSGLRNSSMKRHFLQQFSAAPERYWVAPAC